MASAQTAFIAVFALFLLCCGPPLLSLWICVLRYRRMIRNGQSGKLFFAAFVFSAAAFVLNTAIVLMTGLAVLQESQPIGVLHLAAAALSWLCLWLWIALLFVRPRIFRRWRA